MQPHWREPPPEPRLEPGTVDVWLADLDRISRRVDRALAPDEAARAAGIADPSRAEQWRRSRALLRTLLGRYSGRAPELLELRTLEHGKPELLPAPGGDGEAGRRIRFNLSHSHGLVLLGFCRDGDVGVDIEQDRPGRDVLRLAPRALGADGASALASLPPQRQRQEFLRRWTRREAHAKCMGGGLAGTGVESLGLWTCDLPVQAGTAAAVAASSRPDRLALWTLSPQWS